MVEVQRAEPVRSIESWVGSEAKSVVAELTADVAAASKTGWPGADRIAH